MRRSLLTVIICLLGAGVLANFFLFNGTIPWAGSYPEGQQILKTQAGPPALTTSPAGLTSIIPAASPSPTQSLVKTSEVPSAPTEESTPIPGIANSAGSITGDSYEVSIPVLERRVHELINQQRTGMGLSFLNFDTALADIAREHSEDMATRNYFAHVNLAGQNPTARATAAGYSCRKNYGSYYTYGIAENLFQNNLYSSVTFYSNRDTVYDWNSPDEIARTTVAGWMNSSGHRENILTATFDQEGIGIAIADDGKVYITEDFC